MSTVLSDPLSTSEETWRERATAEPAVPPELIPPPHGVSRRERRLGAAPSSPAA